MQTDFTTWVEETYTEGTNLDPWDELEFESWKHVREQYLDLHVSKVHSQTDARTKLRNKGNTCEGDKKQTYLVLGYSSSHTTTHRNRLL